MDSSRLTSYCTARIYSAGGDGPAFNFSILPSSDPNEEHFPFLTGATIEVDAKTVTKATITFDAPFEEGLMLLNKGVFGVNNILEVQMGYLGSKEDSGLVFGAIMEAQTGIEVTSEGVSGTVSASIGPTIPARYKQSLSPQMADWDGGPSPTFLSDLIESFARLVGYSSVVFEGDSLNKVNKSSSYFTSGRALSLMQVLGKLSSLVQCSWFSRVVAGVYELVIFDHASMSAQKPSRLFVMRGGLFENVGLRETYPIIGLTPEIKGFSFGAIKPSGVTQIDVGRDGTISTSEATPRQTDIQSGNPKGDDGDSSTPAKKGATVVVKEREANQAGVVIENPNAESNESNVESVQQELITMRQTLVTVGLPSIPYGGDGAWESVEVRGASDVFDGLYTVKTATHVWSGSSIETTLSIYRTPIKSDAGVNKKTAGDS